MSGDEQVGGRSEPDAMSIKHPSRSESFGRARGGTPLERRTKLYCEYLLEAGNVVCYMRSCVTARQPATTRIGGITARSSGCPR